LALASDSTLLVYLLVQQEPDQLGAKYDALWSNEEPGQLPALSIPAQLDGHQSQQRICLLVLFGLIGHGQTLSSLLAIEAF
jgi:hypothetical protein